MKTFKQHSFNHFLILLNYSFFDTCFLGRIIHRNWKFFSFYERGLVQIFSIKREGLVLKKKVITYFDSNIFQCYLSECLVCVSVFCLFTPFPLVLLVFYGNNLLFLNLINRYMTSTNE